MGLAGPKNQIKISHDPNNTRWTNDTQSFGHKIMTSQGWQPGQYLGAKDASHAEFHTAANASHIRVSIKDDNLGLGAKVGSGVGHGECTGLDAFKNLLGRLNGKEEDEIEKEQKARDDLRVAIYTERKWGATRFVSGGFLIGDKIQHLIDAEAERIRGLALGSSGESSSSSESEEEAEPKEKSKKSKKRKIEVLEEEHEEPELVVVKVKKSKKERKVEAATEATQERAELSEKKRSKNSKKDRKSKPETNDTPDAAELKRRRKQEKREKRERKENARAEAGVAEEEPQKKKKSRKDKTKAVETPDFSDASQSATKESAPATPLTAESGRSTPIMMQGRHAVRARNIAQKRMASMDVASLNQIFMIKT